jgi:two-component system phosphate regulon response regulator PhoB
MSKKHLEVLVVDDEPAIREMIQFSLERAGMSVRTAADSGETLALISESRPDIILMDWMMPGISGLELTRRLRKDTFTADIPIIMLTAKIGEDNKVSGLEAGTDDYITKPFSPRELLARIHAVMRRSSPSDNEGRLVAGNLVVDTLSRRVTHRDRELQLGPTEYRLLEFFVSHPSRAYSRSQILDYVWGASSYIEERTVDVHIRRLRKVLEPEGCDRFVQTVRGHGYRFSAGE